MIRWLACLGSLALIAVVLLWPDRLDDRPSQPSREQEPSVPTAPLPATPADTPPVAEPPPSALDDSALSPEKEKWLREWLARYADPEYVRNYYWKFSVRPRSPIGEGSERVEQRLLQLLVTLAPDDPLLVPVFRAVAHLVDFPKEHPWLIGQVRALAASSGPDERWRGMSVAAEGFDLPPDLLHDAIRDGDPVIRRLAVRAVGASGIRADWTLAEMATVLSETRREIRLAALKTLERLGEYAAELYPHAISGTESADPAIRLAAVNALTKMPSMKAETGSALIRAAGDEDRSVAHEALWAVAMFGFGADVPIDQVLRDTEPGGEILTCPAVMCLGHHGPAAAVALPRLLVTIRKGGNFTREYALRSLRAIQPGWEPAFETLEWCMGHAYIPTKVAAADVLSDFGPRAIPILEKYTDDRHAGAHVRKVLMKLRE